MTKNEIIERYKDYDERVQEWMYHLINDLYDDMEDVPNSYVLQLDMLAQSCEMLQKANKEIKLHGIVVRDSRGGLVKNSACAIWNAANLTICKLLNQFALTRMSKSKLKENREELTAAEVLARLTE